jgi:hypothetical protein
VAFYVNHIDPLFMLVPELNGIEIVFVNLTLPLKVLTLLNVPELLKVLVPLDTLLLLKITELLKVDCSLKIISFNTE